MLTNRDKKGFPMEFLTKELQKSQATCFRNIFHSEALNMEKTNGAGGIYNKCG